MTLPMPTARDDDAPSFLPELATQRFTVPIRGAALPCSDNRADAGATLVFLHGAVTDLRLWDRHRALIGRRHRTIACTLRYHGEMASRADWPADWPPYGAQTHADDLIELLDRLGTGPVVLVAWSYAGHVAFQAALQRPGLFRGLFVHEPGVPSYVDDPQSLAAWQPGRPMPRLPSARCSKRLAGATGPAPCGA